MKTAILCAWKARMRNAILLHLEVQHPHSPIYRHLNSSVPLLKLYFQGDGCLLKDYRISRNSLEALMRCLGPERRQAWGHHMTVLTTVYWLAHSLSYSVVSRAFQVPLSTSTDWSTRSGGHRCSQAFPDQAACWSRAGGGRAGIPAVGQQPGIPCVCGCNRRVPHKNQGPIRTQWPGLSQSEALPIHTAAGCMRWEGEIPPNIRSISRLSPRHLCPKHSALYKEALYPPPGYFIGGGGTAIAEFCGFFFRGGGPAEVDGSTSSWLSEPDLAGSSSSTVAWLWTASVDVEPLPEATAAVAESIRVGGSMDGLQPMASCMAVKYGCCGLSLSVPVPGGASQLLHKQEVKLYISMLSRHNHGFTDTQECEQMNLMNAHFFEIFWRLQTHFPKENPPSLMRTQTAILSQK
ncbi:hypothetical protein F7725_024439 [Dissostichus mawsoni]|uniref:Uncharacterized protein n=1 Tax=Dissostichus mawsoni TaxID=36200 RepID=A0A7J5Y2B3_DISMA|nr:hypothetical protein F7725_024439 [Dissostichus mawsoni]